MENTETNKNPLDNNKEETVNITKKNVFEFLLYIVGICLIAKGMTFYFDDLEVYTNQFNFREAKYVGGDAYNYIISAARSSAVMIKSLIWVILGCTSILVGRTIK